MMVVALAGCGIEAETDDIATEEVESASSVYQWFSRGAVPSQKSEWQVGLASFNGRLQMVHNGHGTPSELWMSSFNGSSWATNVKLPSTLRSTGGPALTVHGGQLKMVYRAAGQNRLMMSTFNGSTYGTPVTIGSYLGSQQIVSEPTAASYGGQLYVGYCTAHGIRVDRFNGSSWSLVFQNTYTADATCEHVELAVIPDTGALHLVYATIWDAGWGDPYEDMHEQTTYDGVNWAATSNVNHMKTRQPISIVTCNGITHMTHGGYSDGSEVRWAERMYGGWTADFLVPNQYSWGGAALGCFGTRTIMVHNSTTGDLRWLEFGQ